MRGLLLDTHVILWWLTAHPHLTQEAQALIAGSPCRASTASLWEIAIKHKLGKLPVPPDQVLAALRQAGIGILTIQPEHAVATMDLPLLHSDPFDRLLIAQARHETLRLVTADDRLRAYDVDVHVV